jgi:putative ABC transport system permease protein
MGGLRQDVRYAFRRLRRSPAFAAVAMGSLGLGIGATTAMFSIVDAIDFRPLPYRDSDRIVTLREVAPPAVTWCRDCNTSFPTFADWQTQSHSYVAIAAQRGYMRRWWHDNPTGGETEFLPTTDVSPEFFPTLGVGAVLGRGIGVADAAPDAARVVVLADDFWRRRFGADPHVLGQRLTFIPFGTDSRVSYMIVGVMPRGFRFLDARVWMPLLPEGTTARGGHSLQVFGRLKSGISIAQANAELELIARRLAAEYPATNGGWGAHVIPLRTALTQDLGPSRFLLFALVATVLAIATANAATLALSRMETRQTELAVRHALGASRGRLAREPLVESLLLAAAGGTCGVALAVWGVRTASAGLELDRLGMPASVDVRVLGFAFGTSLVVGLTCAVLPSRQAARASVQSVLREQGAGLSGVRRLRIERVLIIAEVAITLVLVTTTGLISKELFRLQRREPGFDAKQLYKISARMPSTWIADSARRRQFAAQASDRLAHVRGVLRLSVAAPTLAQPSLRLLGSATAIPSDARPLAMSVGPDFFQVMRTPILEGRAFTRRDAAGSPPVIIVNQAAKASYWAGKDPVGERVFIGDTSTGEWATVIGVVANAKLFASLTAAAVPLIYRPFDQSPEQQVIVFARTAVQSPRLTSALRAALKDVTTGPIDPMDVLAMDELIGEEVRQERFHRTVLASFALLGLALAAVGVYGVVAYAAAQRTREIGVRVALGASPWNILTLVSRRGVGVAALGLVFGVGGSLAAGHVLRHMLAGMSPYDPGVLAAAVFIMSIVVFTAAYVPAHRAMRVDPAAALRAQV